VQTPVCMTLHDYENPHHRGLFTRLSFQHVQQIDRCVVSGSPGRCGTCGLKYRACPGHFGHIELAVPVYNPLVFM